MLNRLLTAIPTPKAMNRFYHTRGGRYRYNPNGVDHFSYDWDNLIILDACRLDKFKKFSSLPGELYSVESRGSTTDEWMDGNVRDRDLSETVYVTASPALEKNKGDAKLYDKVDVWRDGWDSELGTVHPETMVNTTLETAKRYPNKRIVAHFMQPHYPFIGPTGQNKINNSGREPNNNEFHFWNSVGTEINDISPEIVEQAYDETLQIALGHLGELLQSLQGKTVVSADHGEMLNERAFPIPLKTYGHPRGVYVDELVHVPWLEYQNGYRREIHAESETVQQNDYEDETVSQRLQDLGYKT